jgi:hypothetical protein
MTARIAIIHATVRRRSVTITRLANPYQAQRSAATVLPGSCPGVVRVLGIEPSPYVSFEIKSKIGMYIAMTIPPTVTPRTAIMIGSSSVSSPATAVSTSSS